jgi:two-component system response regulator NreC
MIGVLLADDHAMFREGLKILLKGDRRFRVVGEAADGVAALSLIERMHPEIAFLDVALPRMSGIDVVRSALAKTHSVKCIMLTMHEEPEIAMSAMEAGACGYILKAHTFDELKAAVDAVLGGRTFVSPRIAPALHDMTSGRDVGARALTGREREVLSSIALGRSNKEIAEHLAISVRTVEAHRSRIMRKLGIRSHAGLIHFAASKKVPDAS